MGIAPLPQCKVGPSNVEDSTNFIFPTSLFWSFFSAYVAQYKIDVARVTVWETATPPNFISLSVCVLLLAALVSPHEQ